MAQNRNYSEKLTSFNCFDSSSTICESHWNEWVIDSAVDPELTSLNVVSLSGMTPYDRLLYALPTSERRNDGRLRDKWLKRYAHIEHGGWWCNGIDVLTGEDAEWGQFKPNIPYQYEKKTVGFDSTSVAKNKLIKYEPPRSVPTEIFALFVPLHLWKAIATHYDVPLPENIVVTPEGRALGFWAWIIANPKIPVIITEGAKKAGVILTARYVAIALPGIFNGYRQPKNDWGHKIGNPYLIPQLQAFAQSEKEIIFCFDNDTKPKTVSNVRSAIAKTGKLFASFGCRVSVISWNYPEKGVDDLIVARGQDCFDRLYKARLPLSKFNLDVFLDLSKYKPLRVNERFLSESLVPPENAQIIGLRSPKGSGKTEWLARIVQQCIKFGKPVLVITHRIQLAKALCNRFGIDHIEELRNSETKGVFGYGLCVDSLYSNSQARFNPEDWSEAVVILDECEQVIWHMLNSQTCQDNRVTILENFKQLLKTVVGTGGKIYLSDADLSCVVIDYVQKLIDIPVQTWVAENVYNSKSKRKLINYSGSDPRSIVAALIKAIERGDSALVHTTGQKARSKWGTINLESDLKKRFPDCRILRIDSQSVSDPQHPAYGCIDKLNSILPNYDIVICSPVIETGVSIDLKNHFDAVWCIAYGLQTVDAVCQTVERLRDGIPRHIWVKKTAKNNRIGNGSVSIKSLLRSQHQNTKNNISLLQQAGIDEFDELEVNFSTESLTTWAKRACIVNTGKNNYRASIITKLLASGYELDLPSQNDLKEAKGVHDILTKTRDENYHTYCQAISEADTPTTSELDALSNKKAKSQEERYKERKGTLYKRYGIEVSAELVKKDDRGWYPQLQLQYYLTVGNKYLAQRDRQSLSQIKEQGSGKAFKPDISKKQLSVKIETLKIINIKQFFDRNAEFTKNSLDDWFNSTILPFRFDIKDILGVNINPDKDSAIAVAQRILKKLGLKLEFKCWRGDRSSKQRVYSGCNIEPDERNRVFDHWLARESKVYNHNTVLTFL